MHTPEFTTEKDGVPKQKNVQEVVPTWTHAPQRLRVEEYLALCSRDSSTEPSNYVDDHLAQWEPHCTRIGYCRVSTKYQSLQKQVLWLMARGCDAIYFDRESGKSMDRPGWAALKAAVRPGDTVYARNLDRIGRTTLGILTEVGDLTQRGVSVNIGDLSLDMEASATQEALFSLLAVISSLETRLKEERQEEARQARLAAGLQYGQKQKLDDRSVQSLWEQRQEGASYATLAQRFHISKSSVPNYLHRFEESMTSTALADLRSRMAGEAA